MKFSKSFLVVLMTGAAFWRRVHLHQVVVVALAEEWKAWRARWSGLWSARP